MANRKKLNPDESPRAAFGVRLRTLREGRGWTQEDLSDRMGYSATHISGVEIGRRTPTPKFTASADKALGTGESLARQGEAVLNPAILDGFPQFVVQEGRAVEIRLFELGVLPGLFQSPAYAAAITEGAVQRGAITEQQGDERLTLLDRRQRSLERTPPPQIYAVLDESCLMQQVGGPRVMSTALDHLLALARLPNTVIQVSRFDLGARRSFYTPVTLVTMPDRSQVAYAESALSGQLQRESRFVGPLFTAYHQLQAEALSQAESVAVINQVRKGMS
ncbi:helix-turn-helix transcriptional regulator [Streptomyces albidoflavus]|uniref:helix-turn-helix domain-containing protein n=1 Tax=Streptomyces TaxID=1883 RepID=UPI00081F2621|nr:MULTISPECIES: helix-turn-helix transcriptional regulator [Streptomyces]MCM3820812.1 helix-turn-helix transcriptional regulator [Streptomyces sp. DR3-1]MYQ74465.1 helix-turn-helix domain-containing protein [Streptomyces sp. SID4934]RZD63133.1 XRE family transcriptional regulator [Streptomyces albidoflavus]SCE41965.1 Helix-turn-helix domain-containing protein [Streptomyces sp. ScaeMP-6W]